MDNDNLVVIRGAGDIATGIIYVLKKFSYNLVALEIDKPSVIRRAVSLADAMYNDFSEVEGLVGIKCNSLEDIYNVIKTGNIPIVNDSNGKYIELLRPHIVVDSILAKRNLGTNIGMANIVIGVGPGFVAGVDVHAVIETKRGHYLGRVIYDGRAEPNTGIPGEIGGYSLERVIKSSCEGRIKNIFKIGDVVKKNDVIAMIDDVEVVATIDGVLRGLIREGYYVPVNFKISDIDPICDVNHCYSISDKARLIGFGVLEAINELYK